MTEVQILADYRDIPADQVGYFDRLTAHINPDCPHLDDDHERSTFGERAGFICTCVDKLYTVEVAPPIDPATGKTRLTREARNEERAETAAKRAHSRSWKGHEISEKQAAFLRSLIEERPEIELGSLANLADMHGEMIDPTDIDTLLATVEKGAASTMIDYLLKRPVTNAAASPPPTDGQVRFIRSLLDRAGADVDAAIAALTEAGQWTKSGASPIIDQLKAGATEVAGVELPTRPAPAAGEYSPTFVDEPGVYVDNTDGTWVKIQRTRDGERLYGKTWTDDQWDYEGAKSLRRDLRKATAEEAAAFGHATGHCVFCSLTLTDERSVTAGYGPKCAGREGLPWG